jgi:hypothetical protein
MTATAVLGIFLTVVLVVLVYLMFRDWDNTKPGRQNFNHRKRK